MHRVVMENHIGRLLTSDEVVHHKDHNKKNNDISNLELLNAKEHCKLHGKDAKRKYLILKCPQCGKIFNARYHKSLSVYGLKECEFCSKECSKKFHRNKRKTGITSKMQRAIDENIIAEYSVSHDQLPLHDETYHGEY